MPVTCALGLLSSLALLPTGCTSEADEPDLDTTALEASTASCVPTTWDGRDYLLCNGGARWQDAAASCESAGMSLVSVDSAAEDAFVRSSMSGTYWIGGSDLAEEGEWNWHQGAEFWLGTSGGINLNGLYTHWAPGEPNNSFGEDCARVLNNGTWNDIPCNFYIPYVCEKDSPLAGPTVPDTAPSDHCSFVKNGDDGYWFCRDSVPRDTAAAACANAGFDLARIDDMAENEFIDRHIVARSWLGAEDRGFEGSWRWQDGVEFWSGDAGGAPQDGLFAHWDSMEPNDQFHEGCLEMYTDGTWNDVGCGWNKHYVCERSTRFRSDAPSEGCYAATYDQQDYWLCPERIPYADAAASCESEGAALVKIEAQPENRFIAAHLSGSSWMGANDLQAEGHWVWPDGVTFWNGAASGSPESGAYVAWAFGEPNDYWPSEECGEIDSGGKWNDIPCKLGRSYVCESSLIKTVDVSNLAPCVDEEITVSVETIDPIGTNADAATTVFVNGGRGSEQTLSFNAPGSYQIAVSAYRGSVVAGRSIDVDVRYCEGMDPVVRLGVQMSMYEPYLVEFRVLNPGELTGANRTYHWDFGDGTSLTTTTPYVEHSYVGALDATTPLLVFPAEIRVTRDGKPDAFAHRRINLPNHYAETRPRGFVRPPVVTASSLQRNGRALQGSFTLTNLEPAQVTLGNMRITRHFCDPDREPVEETPNADHWRVDGHSGSTPLTLAANSTTSHALVVDGLHYGSDTCGLSVTMSGTTSDAVQVRVSAHFETPAPGIFATAIADSSVLALLNNVAAAGMVDANHITGHDLEILFKNNLIAALPDISNIAPAPTLSLFRFGTNLGDECDPEATPPTSGMSCQVTDEWKIAPPLVRNALKGDIFIVAGCGEIGQLLRVVLPRQSYSHEAIMLRNYYELGHTTFNKGRIMDTIGDSPRRNLGEEELRFGWPGAVQVSVLGGFTGRDEIDPEGAIRRVSGFSAQGTQCDGDMALNPPIVIRPVPGSAPSVRAGLHAAADIAADIESHYRFFGYSQGNIAFGPDGTFDGNDYFAPDGSLAEVSTTYIWHALKAAGVQLEGDTLEPADVRMGAVLPTGEGVIDGLYFYSEAERREGARQVYSSTYNAAKQKHWDVGGTALSFLIAITSDQADDIASQFTNCFASDDCGEDGAQSRDYEDPGTGVTVSPDNFRFWDAPATGGSFGDEELLAYRSADYRRIHRWAPTSSAGSLTGNVVFSGGLPVAGALVTAAGQDTGTDGFGLFAFPSIPAGQYELRAERTVLRSDPTQACPADGSALCDVLVAVEVIEIQTDVETNVTLVLEPEAAIPPPTIEVHNRLVTFAGSVHVVDDEVGSDETRTVEIDGECEVSPLARRQDVTVRELFCTGGEVTTKMTASCELLDDNVTVRVAVRADLWEDNACNTDDHEDSDAQTLTAHPCDEVSNCEVAVGLHLLNSGFGGGDRADYNFTVRNDPGDEIIDLPNVQPENLRRVLFNADVYIRDDEVFGSESDTFVLGEECLVDPWAREDRRTWSRCVGNEVRVKIAMECTLAENNVDVSVDVKAELFEGASCNTDDREGSQNNSRIVRPCNGSCAPTVMDFNVNNSGVGGGDKSQFSMSILNEQR